MNTANGSPGFFHRWLRQVLVAFLFGFWVAALISLGLLLDFEPVKKLERESVDFSAKLGTAVFDLSNKHLAAPNGVSPIYLVDIDVAGCSRLASDQACRFERFAQPELIAALAEGIERATPKVAVFDILLPPDLGPNVSAMLSESSVPLLVPMDIREAETSNVLKLEGYFLLRNSTCGEVTCGNLQYLPSNATLTDGKVRQFATDSTVAVARDLSDESNEKILTLPTIPYRAATLASQVTTLNAENGFPGDISYSIPSFALVDASKRSELRQKYLTNVEHFFLSELLSDDWKEVEFPVLPQNAILIIGSSASEGGDLHNTPLGPMSGMEILANAIRSMQLSRPSARQGIVSVFLQKLGAVLYGLLPITIAEASLTWAAIRRERAHQSGQVTVLAGQFWDRYSWLILAMMLVLFVGELILSMFDILSQMRDPASRSAAVDAIWPVVGVLLTSFVAFSSKVIAKLEWVVECSIAQLQKVPFTSRSGKM